MKLKKITLVAIAVVAVLLTLAIETRAAYLPALDGPLGTEITESGTYTGTLSDVGPVTFIDKMGYTYYEIDWYWIDLDRFDMLRVTLEMDGTVDFDLAVWHTEEDFVQEHITGALGTTEEVSFYNSFESTYQICVGCYVGSGDYTLTVEVERIREIPGSGTETGSLSPGEIFEYVDIYKLVLEEGDYATISLDPPSTADFNINVYCKENWDMTAGHDEHFWHDWQGVGETETVEITGSSVPHDGTYYVWLYQAAGSGSYTLTFVIDRTPPSITDIEHGPSKPQPDDTVTVTANVTDVDSGVKTVALLYSTDGGTIWSSITMTKTIMLDTGVEKYRAVIPKQADGTTVQFKVSAEDNAGFESESAVDSYTVKKLIFGLDPLMFYGLVGGLAVAVVAAVFFLMRRGKAPSPPPPPPTAPPAYCQGCGSPLPPGTTFCPKCGKKST